jgi:hypothetical protein
VPAIPSHRGDSELIADLVAPARVVKAPNTLVAAVLGSDPHSSPFCTAAGIDETMSHYLVRDLKRYGVAVRDRSEIAQLHGQDGQLETATLTNGERWRSPTCSFPSVRIHAPTGLAR